MLQFESYLNDEDPEELQKRKDDHNGVFFPLEGFKLLK